ncbi:MAG: hypothetical protein GXO10_03285 [Crenarchaeota archaeon]|nr:hypothetical protein [Thermoproteota archaeon]
MKIPNIGLIMIREAPRKNEDKLLNHMVIISFNRLCVLINIIDSSR